MTKNLYKLYLAKIISWSPGSLAKNTLLVTVGMSLRAILQFVLFVSIARFLGVREYGKFIAVMAVITFLVPLVGFGTQILVLREVAIDKARFARHFGKSLVVIGTCAFPFLLIALIIGNWLLPKEIPLTIVFNIALAELLFGPVIDLSGKVFQAIERFTHMMVIVSGLIMLRLIFFGFMLAVGGPIDAANWSTYYMMATALAMVGALGIVFKNIGLPKLNFQSVFATMREGVDYALTGAASRVNSEIDKVFLARLTSLEITGAYSVAYRFTDIVMIPVNALLESSAARFFREGANGIISSSTYAKKLLPIPVLYASLGGLLLYFCADFIPLLLGSEYIVSVPMLKLLAILPLMLMLRSFLCMIVIAGGHPRYNCIVYLAGALINIGLNFYLIPRFSWAGAALATIFAEIAMIFFLWLIIREPIIGRV